MITFKELTLVDAITILELENSIFLKDAWSLSQIKEELAGSRRKYIAALNEGEIIGYAGIAITAPTGDIHNVAILPTFRRQGIARQILTMLEDWAIAEKVEVLTLEMRVGNEQAAPLYQSLGYRDLAIRKNYYGQGIDAVVMQKNLLPSQKEM